jgi:hypothetical protein
MADSVLIDRRLRYRRGRRDRSCGRAAAPHVHRAFQHGGSWTTGCHRTEGFGDEARGLRRLADADAKIDQTSNDAGLVANLMEMSKPAPDRGLCDLSDQRQHGCVHSIGSKQRSRGIEQPGSRHDGVDLRLGGGEGSTQRHIGRALLVTGVDGAHVVASPEQRIEQRIVVHARQRIDGVDTMGDEGADGCFRGRHPYGRTGGGFLGLLCHDPRTSERAVECADRRHPVEASRADHLRSSRARPRRP